MMKFDPSSLPELRVGMIGFGMIFEETYRPFFEAGATEPVYSSESGAFYVRLAAGAIANGCACGTARCRSVLSAESDSQLLGHRSYPATTPR